MGDAVGSHRPDGLAWVLLCQILLLVPLHARQLSEAAQTQCSDADTRSHARCDFDVSEGSLLQGQFGGPKFCCTRCGVNQDKVCCPSGDGVLELDRSSWLEESLCRSPANSTSTALILLGVQPKGNADQVRRGSYHRTHLLRFSRP